MADNRSLASLANLYWMGSAPELADQLMTVYDRSNTRLASLLTRGLSLAWPAHIGWVKYQVGRLVNVSMG